MWIQPHSDNIFYTMIDRVLHCDEKELGEINSLLSQLSKDITPLDSNFLVEKLSNPSFYLLSVKEENEIIAMASLSISDILSCKKAFIEDVVVHQDHRGKGFGKDLIKYIIELATSLNIDKVELTSRPERMEANLLYQKLGFQKRDTNYYQLKIS